MKLWRRLFAAILLAALLCACSAPGETGGPTEGAVSGFQSSSDAAALQTDEPEMLPTPTPEQFGLTGAYAALFEAILEQTSSSWSLTLPSIAVRGSRTYPDGSTAYFCTIQTGDYDVRGEEIVDQGARSFRAAVTLKGSGEDTVWTDVRTVEEWETVSVLEELGMDELAQLAQAGEALPVVWQMPEGNELLADYCQGAGLSLTTAGSSSKFS